MIKTGINFAYGICSSAYLTQIRYVRKICLEMRNDMNYDILNKADEVICERIEKDEIKERVSV